MLFLVKHETNLIVLSCFINPYKYLNGYLHFPNNLHKRPYVGLYDKSQKFFPNNGNSFQRKSKLIATPYIFSSIMLVFERVFIPEQIAENRFESC